MNLKELKQHLAIQLDEDEGCVPWVYRDSRGYWTIGRGHCVDKRVNGQLPQVIIEQLFEYDVNEKLEQVLAHIPFAERLDTARLGVLVNMCFNMGIENLLGFKKMLAAMERGDWDKAAEECADPDYVAQVGNRAFELAHQLKTGVWQHG